jgi:acyl-CoA hydrolase
MIGKQSAALIPEGSCFQMGIGFLPDAITADTAELANHKNLGIRTEVFADRVLNLVENGV